ncbi:prepilin peptidase [Gordonia sp. NPDC003424]
MVVWVVLLWLCRITVGDLRTRRIPTALVWPGIVATVGMATTHPMVGLTATVAAVPYLVAALAGLCGGGDAKLAFVLGGLVADVATALLVVFLASIIGFAAHAGLRTRDALPHAPALFGATVCLLLSGGAWSGWSG